VLKVHLQFDPEPEQVSRLAALLDPSIRLTVGEHPHPADFEILVHGAPTREDLLASPHLHTVIVPWAGPPIETLDLLKKFPHIAVHNLPYNAGPTAEVAIALLLAAAKMIIPYDRSLRRHQWGPADPDLQSCLLLEGKTALILGYGRVGRRVANGCRGLGMNAWGVRRRPDPQEQVDVYGIDSLHELLPKAAALIICMPHTHETTGLIGERELALLPGEAVLVNVARGDIVVEAALYDSLKERRIFAAAIDVWYRYPERLLRGKGEPVAPSNFPFHELDNVVMSPHRAGWSPETEELRILYLSRLLNAAAKNLPMPYRLDPDRGY
jgi:phosphoglycerate dehydrogenase-like enzyme